MSRKILVTGARGYLGGRLVQRLADDAGLEVTGTTRGTALPPRGWPTAAALRRLDPLSQSEAEIAAMLAGTDTVIHLAAANEIDAARDPAGATTSGVVATIKLLRAAQAANCRRFIFLSTIHVYGSPLAGQIVESHQAEPVHPYAITHRAAEDFVRAAHRNHQIEGIVLRLSNGIGAPAWRDVDRWTLVGNDFSRQAVESGKIILRTSGLQWRDFILLGDFAGALQHMIDVPQSRLGDGLFNLGGQLPLRIIDVAERVARRASEMLQKEVAVERPAASPGESFPALNYNIDRLVMTGFSPSSAVALDAELDATLRLCQKGE